MNMNGVLWAFCGTLFTFSVTALGALNVFLSAEKWAAHCSARSSALPEA